MKKSLTQKKSAYVKGEGDKEMEKTIQELYNLYLEINEMGWIKSKRIGPGGIGYTFETLLNKEEDAFPLADFKGVEIKTMRKNSRRVLHLFNITPDGNYLFPIKRVLDVMGYPSKHDCNYKVFSMTINARDYTMLGLSKRAKLYVNREEGRIDLIAESSTGKDLNIDISWSFDLIKERIEWKLKHLIVVLADSIIINNCEYFKYSEVYFYELRDFDFFLTLIEIGVIAITFNIDFFRDSRRMGQIYDHGTCFSFPYCYIGFLYKRIFCEKK